HGPTIPHTYSESLDERRIRRHLEQAASYRRDPEIRRRLGELHPGTPTVTLSSLYSGQSAASRRRRTHLLRKPAAGQQRNPGTYRPTVSDRLDQWLHSAG